MGQKMFSCLRLPFLIYVIMLLIAEIAFSGTAFASPSSQSNLGPFPYYDPKGPNPYSHHGLGDGQCTWYAWSQRTDLPWFNGDLGGDKGDAGDAKNWADSAFRAGFLVDGKVSQGDIAVFPGDAQNTDGHVAYVHKVRSSDGYYNLWEYNLNNDKSFHNERWLKPDGRVQFIHKKEKTPEASYLKPDFSPPPESGSSAKLKPDVLDRITQGISQFFGVNQSAPQPPVIEAPANPPHPLPPASVHGTSVIPPPSLFSPSNGASLSPTTDVTLSWNAQPGAVQYKVEVWGGPYNVMPSCDWQSGTSCTIHQMWPGTMSWHVKARDANGHESDWSDTWNFTIEQPGIITPTTAPVHIDPPPNQFHLISPSGDAQLPNGTLPTLQWQSTSDPDGDQVQYDVIIDNANSPEARQPGQPPGAESGLLNGTSWQPTGKGLENGGRYTWYILADDGHGNRTGSIEHWQFTIALHHVSSGYDPCPVGIGPSSPQYPSGIKPGSYPPTTLIQEQRQWLFVIFGNPGIASVGYGGQECGTPTPTSVPRPTPTNTPISTLPSANTSTQSTGPTPTNTKPPTYTPTFTPTPTPTLRPCPPGVGPGPTVYKAGSYDPTKLTQQERQWLWDKFETPGIAPVGYGGQNCR